MEEGVFRASAVAKELEQNFVEVRIHYDHPDKAKVAASDALRIKLVDGATNSPLYLLLDPRDERILARRDRPTSEAGFLEFLAAGRPTSG